MAIESVWLLLAFPRALGSFSSFSFLDIILTDSCVSLSFSIEKVKKNQKERHHCRKFLKNSQPGLFFFFFGFPFLFLFLMWRTEKRVAWGAGMRRKNHLLLHTQKVLCGMWWNPWGQSCRIMQASWGHSYQAYKQVLTTSAKFSYYCCSVTKLL